MSVTLNGTSGLTFNDGSSQNTSAYGGGFAMRNRIINGAMVIDQRNAGASVTRNATDNVYTLDRWNTRAESSDGVYTVQQVVDGPSGFINSLKVTVTTADASIGAAQVYALNQAIEGFNIADFNWGATAASAGKTAQTVTLSFWVKSTLTGSFGASIINGSSNRSYPFLYTISAANTWEQKSVTIAGDTSGTWATDNTAGLLVTFAIGTGSNELGTVNTWGGALYRGASGQTQIISTLNATWQVTGVQLEKGSTATSFDYRPYGTELQLCQRYLPCWNWSTGNDLIGFGYSYATTASLISVPYTVTPRVSPTGITVTGVSNMTLRNGFNNGGTPTAISINVNGSFSNGSIVVTSTAGTPTIASGQGAFLFATAAAQIQFTGCEL